MFLKLRLALFSWDISEVATANDEPSCFKYFFNLQDQFFQLVLRTLMSIRQNQVEPVLARLDGDQLDLLMKYVYRGFESPSDGSSGLSET